jgi:hypothetical protein
MIVHSYVKFTVIHSGDLYVQLNAQKCLLALPKMVVYHYIILYH